MLVRGAWENASGARPFVGLAFLLTCSFRPYPFDSVDNRITALSAPVPLAAAERPSVASRASEEAEECRCCIFLLTHLCGISTSAMMTLFIQSALMFSHVRWQQLPAIAVAGLIGAAPLTPAKISAERAPDGHCLFLGIHSQVQLWVRPREPHASAVSTPSSRVAVRQLRQSLIGAVVKRSAAIFARFTRVQFV